MLGRQEEIKPIGQPGQYVGFPSLPLPLPFTIIFIDNELSYSKWRNIVDSVASLHQAKHSGPNSWNCFTIYNFIFNWYVGLSRLNGFLFVAAKQSKAEQRNFMVSQIPKNEYNIFQLCLTITKITINGLSSFTGKFWERPHCYFCYCSAIRNRFLAK